MGSCAGIRFGSKLGFDLQDVSLADADPEARFIRSVSFSRLLAQVQAVLEGRQVLRSAFGLNLNVCD